MFSLSKPYATTRFNLSELLLLDRAASIEVSGSISFEYFGLSNVGVEQKCPHRKHFMLRTAVEKRPQEFRESTAARLKVLPHQHRPSLTITDW